MKLLYRLATLAVVATTTACATPLPPDVSTRNRADIISALNEARSKAGVATVKGDSRLDAVARQRAPKAWLNQNNLRAAHAGFGAAVEGSGFPGAWTGEAYWAGPPSDSPAAIIAYLMASPPHRAILMSPRATVCAAASSADRRDMTVAIACGRL